MPVGLIDAVEFAVAEEQLSPGDKVVIYTDGVTEAQNTEARFFGKKRLREQVAAHAAEGCAAIHDAIQEAVAAFTEGAPQSDDITVVVLEFLPGRVTGGVRLRRSRGVSARPLVPRPATRLRRTTPRSFSVAPGGLLR